MDVEEKRLAGGFFHLDAGEEGHPVVGVDDVELLQHRDLRGDLGKLDDLAAEIRAVEVAEFEGGELLGGGFGKNLYLVEREGRLRRFPRRRRDRGNRHVADLGEALVAVAAFAGLRVSRLSWFTPRRSNSVKSASGEDWRDDHREIDMFRQCPGEAEARDSQATVDEWREFPTELENAKTIHGEGAADWQDAGVHGRSGPVIQLLSKCRANINGRSPG